MYKIIQHLRSTYRGDRCRIWLFLFVGQYIVYKHMGIYILLKKITAIYFMFILSNIFAISDTLYCPLYLQYKVSYIANILDVDFEFFQP